MKKIFIILILLFSFSLASCSNKKESNNTNTNTLLDIKIMKVLTNSMDRTGDYYPSEWDNYEIKELKIGDKIKIKTSVSCDEMKIGDIICFYDDVYGYNCLRIVDIFENSFYVQGDRTISLDKGNRYFPYNDWLIDRNLEDNNQNHGAYGSYLYDLENSEKLYNVSFENVKGKVVGFLFE